MPEWGAAFALPSEGLILVPGYAPSGARGFEEGRVLAHEWAHLGLHQYLNGLNVPRWFSEGYAEWSSSGWNPASAWRLRVALALRQAPALDSLSLTWPARRGEAEIAYLLSATAIEYLVSESGVAGLESFLQSWKAEGSFEVAFRGTYGVTTGQFEEDWRAFVRKRYGWLLILSESLVFWGLLGVLLTGAWWVRRRQSRERMARLRATDPPPTPVFWNGPQNGPQGSNPAWGPGYPSTGPPSAEDPQE